MPSRRSKRSQTPSELFRAPIITDGLIIREATRADAQALEQTMEAAHLEEAGRTSDGARRFDVGLAEVPVWSAARAVCLKGSVRIVGGVVFSEVDTPTGDTRRIGWWLGEGAERYGTELVRSVHERLREMGVDTVVIHVRADDDLAIRIAEDTGFTRRDAVRHTTSSLQEIDFWEYVKSS